MYLRLSALSAIGLLSLAAPALAGDQTVAWGTGGGAGTSGRLIASATLHKLEGEYAQIESIGRQVTTMFRSVTSCGTCVYYSIEGDRNSINGNSVTGSNSGTVTGSANFRD